MKKEDRRIMESILSKIDELAHVIEKMDDQSEDKKEIVNEGINLISEIDDMRKKNKNAFYNLPLYVKQYFIMIKMEAETWMAKDTFQDLDILGKLETNI